MSEILSDAAIGVNGKTAQGYRTDFRLGDSAAMEMHGRYGADLPLCVDLDGTLIKTDMLFETLFVLLKRNPLYLFLLPLWLLRGKAHLKSQIAQRVCMNTSCLPYNVDFLQFLQQQYEQGRKLILATACHSQLAQQIAAELGIFAEVLASDGKNNLSGQKKLQILRHRFGARGFVYAGNAKVDLKIWREANASIVVNAPHRLAQRAHRFAPVSHVFSHQDGLRRQFAHFLKAIRVHQWVKNVLIFVPLLTAHQLTNAAMLSAAVLAFIAFSLCSSSVYLLNDLLDLEADRLHTTKKNRPFAAGHLSIVTGMGLIPLFLGASLYIASLLPPDFLTVLLGYFALTLAYSFYLKQVAIVDTILLAMLYTARIVAGAAAIAVVTSQWLLAFSAFLFLSLALVKRFSELHALGGSNKKSTKGRGYLANDLEQVSNLGASSGYVSVLVFALYINSAEISGLYRNPEWLWAICPLMLYWISRVWLLAQRGRMNQDPIVFAIKDRVSYVLGAIAGVVMFLAV